MTTRSAPTSPPDPRPWISHEGVTDFIDTGNDAFDDGSPLGLLPAARRAVDQDLVAARRQLERARRLRDPEALDQALDAVDALLGSLDAMAALDTLAALPAQDGVRDAATLDRLEPWPLLREAWSEVEPLAVARGVQARFHAHGDAEALGAVYGLGRWLHRLLRECLESAVLSAPVSGVMHIDYCQTGPRAMIIFRDSQALQGARAAARLVLCQQIAQLHGGELRVELDDDRRDVLIDLPTGAPFQSPPDTLLADQASRVAHEWATLQARARQRRQDLSPAAALRPSEFPAGDPT